MILTYPAVGTGRAEIATRSTTIPMLVVFTKNLAMEEVEVCFNMSWHCWLCGGPDHWIRGKEKPSRSAMVELEIYDPFGGKNSTKVRLENGVVHADCLMLALRTAQHKWSQDYLDEEFDFLENFIKKENGENEKDKLKLEQEEYKEMKQMDKLITELENE